MIPLKDDNPTPNFPIVTVIIIAVNVIVHVMLMPYGDKELRAVFMQFGFIPGRLFAGEWINSPAPPVITLLSSMFLHGGFIHLAGNMLYLWIFGNNIEDIMGPIRFTAFYLLCGIGAAMLQSVIKPGSVIPMIGASGAISGVMGAYLIRFPKARITVLFFLFFFIRIFQVSASLVLGFWILFQFISGFGSLGGEGGGVAFFAHIGGFAFGILLVKVFEKQRKYYGRWSPFTG